MGFIYDQLIRRLPYPTTLVTGETYIVTGSNVGLGFEAARHLVRLNAAKVIIAVRSIAKGEEAKRSIESSTGRKGVVEVWSLDLGSYASVKSFAEKATKLERLDCVLENAGIAVPKNVKMEEDESTITVNVVSTFLLGLLLLPKLRESAEKYNTKTKIVIVSSEVHGWTNFPEWKAAPEGHIFDYISHPDTADMKSRYPLSKLLEVLFVRELANRISQKHPKEDYPVIINFLNPGLCHSQLSRNAPFTVTLLKFFLARPTEHGSRTEVHAAVDAGPESFGKYLSNCTVSKESSFVRSDEGKEAGRRVYEELMAKLEKIQPGISANL